MPQLQTRIKDLARSGDPSRYFTVKMYPPPEDKLDTTHREYRYILSGPPRQMNDQVIRMIIKTIRELSKDHMLFAAAGIWPHNLDQTLPIWPGHAGGASKLYAFTQMFEEFPIATEICVARGTTELTTDNILVRKKKEAKMKGANTEHWTPLKRWLLELPLPAQLTEGVDSRGIPRAILAQQRWWSKRGKCFRLMSLPLEIRLIIFQYILGENIYPGVCIDPVTQQEKVTLGNYRRDAMYHMEEPDWTARPDSPNYAVLLSNKSLRQEAFRAGFQGSRKHFTCQYVLRRVIIASATSSYNQLSRIYLHQSTSEHFNFFGAFFSDQTHPVIQYSANRCNACLFQGIPGLKHLELFFPSPYSSHRHSTPWFNFSSTTWDYPCQKIAVDWILTFAFPYIKDIPNVHLIGSVKRCTKSKWYYILGKEYGQRKLDYRTHGYDQAAEIAALLGSPMNHALRCDCPASCAKQPAGLLKFDHDDVYGKPPPPPPPGPPLVVGVRSSLKTSALKPTPSSIAKKNVLWSKVLMAPSNTLT